MSASELYIFVRNDEFAQNTIRDLKTMNFKNIYVNIEFYNWKGYQSYSLFPHALFILVSLKLITMFTQN